MRPNVAEKVRLGFIASTQQKGQYWLFHAITASLSCVVVGVVVIYVVVVGVGGVVVVVVVVVVVITPMTRRA